MSNIAWRWMLMVLIPAVSSYLQYLILPQSEIALLGIFLAVVLICLLIGNALGGAISAIAYAIMTSYFTLPAKLEVEMPSYHVPENPHLLMLISASLCLLYLYFKMTHFERERILNGAYLNALNNSACVINHAGEIIFVNDAWRRFAAENGANLATLRAIGENYLAAFNDVMEQSDAYTCFQGIQSVLQGDKRIFSFVYPCHSPTKKRWFRLEATPLASQAAGVVILHVDITKHKLRELKETELTNMLANSQALANLTSWKIDLRNGAIIWHLGDYETSNYINSDLLPLNLEDLFQKVHPADRQTVHAWLMQIQQGKHTEIEFRFKDLEQPEQWWVANGSLFLEDKRFIIGSFQNVTAKKSMEQQLLLWANAFRHCALGMSICSPDKDQIITCNPKFAAMLGYAEVNELIGMQVKCLYPASEQSRVTLLRAQIDVEGHGSYESWYQHCNGSLFPVRVELTTVKDAGDVILYRIATVKNISEVKAKEQKIVLLSEALNAAANAVSITDNKGLIIWTNNAFTQLTGYSESEALGKNHSELIKSGLHAPEFFTQMWNAIKSGEVWHSEVINRRKDGSIYHEEQTITGVRDEQGNIQNYVAIKQDITPRRQLEQELEDYRKHLECLVDQRTAELNKACQEAERLSQVKSQFMANMSHEIRTPMNAIIGFCYVLKRSSLDHNTAQIVNKIDTASNSLLSIINDILDFSKIESGNLSIEQIPFQLSTVLDELAVTLEALVMHKALEIAIIPAYGIDTVIGDPGHLKQVLTNLLGNAIKFSQQGHVLLKISLEGRDQKQLHVRFTVRDTGIGMSSEKLEHIFSPFHQADNTISRRFGGTGLGLSISKKLVELMGGEIQVHSTVNQGSEFTFVLPLVVDEGAEPVVTWPQDLKILIADDQEISREALSATATFLGWQATTVSDVESALAELFSRDSEQKAYEVLLLDWKMLGIDGLETARILHSQLAEKNLNHFPAIILMSANSENEITMACADLSVDYMLAKPITATSLSHAVKVVLDKRQPAVASALDNSMQSGKLANMRILVVDDCEFNRELAKLILEFEGAEVSHANDGQEAIEWIQMHHAELDIVLMDLHMPVMDGYAATRWIRERWSKEQLPVVALTADVLAEDRLAVLNGGMNDFFTKPLEVGPTIQAIHNLVQFRRD